MKARTILIALAVKYQGDWQRIYNDIANKITPTSEEIAKVEYLEKECITLLDENYPSMLKEIYKPPFVLFTKGNKDLLNNNDMVRMLNDFSINYNPEFPLGLIKMSSEIKGSVNALLLKNMDMYIGSNHFVGDILFSKKEGRNLLKTNLKANKFEFERFIYNKNTRNETGVFRPKTERVPFLPKPTLSKAKIDYSWLKNWDMEAKINVDDLSLQNYALKNTSWTMVLNKQILKVAQFIGEKENGLPVLQDYRRRYSLREGL